MKKKTKRAKRDVHWERLHKALKTYARRKPKSGLLMLRVWANKTLISSFRRKCDEEGVYVQDAFNEFMQWYVGKP